MYVIVHTNRASVNNPRGLPSGELRTARLETLPVSAHGTDGIPVRPAQGGRLRRGGNLLTAEIAEKIRRERRENL